jgi:hypothetical protein
MTGSPAAAGDLSCASQDDTLMKTIVCISTVIPKARHRPVKPADGLSRNGLERCMRIGESLSSMGIELLTSEAGASFMECALVGSLVLVFCMLLVLAWNKNT